MTVLNLDFYTRGKVKPDASGHTADRNLVLPDFDLDLGQLISPIAEGFESATFPPAQPKLAWTAPSERYPSDLAWERMTSGPLVGTASASRPAAQTHGQNSSLGLNAYLTQHARLQFRYKVVSEDNFDFLRFFVDGVESLKLSSGATAQEGRFVTDTLSPGRHTFDWRFTKDGSVTESGELALVDAVEVVPEVGWQDQRLRMLEREDFLWFATASRWIRERTGAGDGAILAGVEGGIVELNTGAAPGNKTAFTLGSATGGGLALAREWIFEGRFKLSNVGSIVAAFGMWDGATGNDEVSVAVDSAASANWTLRANNAGVVTTADTKTAFDASFHDFRIAVGTGYASAQIDGKALQTTGATRFTLNTGLPTAAILRPFFRVEANAAADRQLDVDWLRLTATR